MKFEVIESEECICEIPYERFKSFISVYKTYKNGISRYMLKCDDTKMYLKPNYDWQDYLNMLELQGKYNGNIDDKLEQAMAEFVDFVE